jgi:ankyrin repeat protein
MHHLPDVSDMQLLFSSATALFVLGLLLFSPIPVPALPAPLTGPCTDIAAKAADIPRYSSLFQAAAENCVESVCQLLQKGADINARNKYVLILENSSGIRCAHAVLTLLRQNLTALHASILPSENQHKMVQLLLQHGADVNAKNAYASCDCHPHHCIH